MQKENNTPKPVVDDGWLAPQTDQINERISRFEHELAAIKDHHGSLFNHASGHLFTGIHIATASPRQCHVVQFDIKGRIGHYPVRRRQVEKLRNEKRPLAWPSCGKDKFSKVLRA